MRTCRLHEAEKLSIRVLTRGETDRKDIKTAINKLIGRANREVIRGSRRDAEDRQRDRGEGSATSNVPVYSDDSEDERSEDYDTEQDSVGSEAWYDELTPTEQELLINLRDAREKLNDSVKNGGFWPPDKNDKRVDRRKEKGRSSGHCAIDQLKVVTTCNRCGKRGHWESECHPKNAYPR